MPTIAFGLEIKSLSAEGLFQGLASTYGNIDLGGDVVERGAFVKTLAGGRLRPLLWQHRDPIGTVTLTDTDAGLLADGQLALDVQQAREAMALVKAGAVRGLSIGFEAVRSDYQGDIRHLREIKLWEVSLTHFPMNEAATVRTIKSAQLLQVRSALHELRREVLAGLKG